MGKNKCNIEKKWCKYCKHDTCHWLNTNTLLKEIHRCPKRESTRTVRLKDYIQDADIASVMNAMTKWHENEDKNEKGYDNVLNLLKNKKAKKSDWFIEIEKVTEPEHETFGNIIPEITYLHCHGISPDKREWAIELEPWDEWLGMNITRKTLDSFSKNEIIAEILYEMTFYGFTENKVSETKKEIIDSFNEIQQ